MGYWIPNNSVNLVLIPLSSIPLTCRGKAPWGLPADPLGSAIQPKGAFPVDLLSIYPSEYSAGKNAGNYKP
jgi:hypothetical protein